jgi:hypothetical protein
VALRSELWVLKEKIDFVDEGVELVAKFVLVAGNFNLIDSYELSAMENCWFPRMEIQ